MGVSATVYHSRRLLLNPLFLSPPSAPTPSAAEVPRDNSNFDANVVMVLSVLLCALICSLGLNSIIRCALRCSNLVSTDAPAPAARLANTGIKKKALKTFPIVSYAAELKLDSECAICISDFAAGERVRVLPKCHHGFHVRCIDKWLGSHSSCPTCRHCLIQTCEKIVGLSSSPPHHLLLRIEPLQPEAFIRNHAT
ncbi:RING-H2 finger protein ATL78-like [Salvia miltiorrhiza]|uniref:RING-H2 finger protein ATL78-like n=1 Tax=Salvia miltiorrhiza TaxID=226208 RepID=UPI0025ABA4A9|nr:RING-H2 finger protein ATL78-like [Salvia miltiorrhiza]